MKEWVEKNRVENSSMWGQQENLSHRNYAHVIHTFWPHYLIAPAHVFFFFSFRLSGTDWSYDGDDVGKRSVKRSGRNKFMFNRLCLGYENDGK